MIALVVSDSSRSKGGDKYVSVYVGMWRLVGTEIVVPESYVNIAFPLVCSTISSQHLAIMSTVVSYRSPFVLDRFGCSLLECIEFVCTSRSSGHYAVTVCRTGRLLFADNQSRSSGSSAVRLAMSSFSDMSSSSLQHVSTPAAPGNESIYSQAVILGNTIYCSGQIGFDPQTVSRTAASQPLPYCPLPLSSAVLCRLRCVWDCSCNSLVRHSKARPNRLESTLRCSTPLYSIPVCACIPPSATHSVASSMVLCSRR